MECENMNATKVIATVLAIVVLAGIVSAQNNTTVEQPPLGGNVTVPSDGVDLNATGNETGNETAASGDDGDDTLNPYFMVGVLFAIVVIIVFGVKKLKQATNFPKETEAKTEEVVVNISKDDKKE